MNQAKLYFNPGECEDHVAFFWGSPEEVNKAAEDALGRGAQPARTGNEEYDSSTTPIAFLDWDNDAEEGEMGRIYVPEGEKFVSTLAHEATHAALCYVRQVVVPFMADRLDDEKLQCHCDESCAHIVEWFIEQGMGAYRPSNSSQ